MKQEKLASITRTAAIAYELGLDYSKVYLKEAARECGQGKKDLLNLSQISDKQMEFISKTIVEQYK